MIPTTDAFLDATRSQTGLVPSMDMRIFANRGIKGAIDTKAQFESEISTGIADVNVSTTRKPGSIVMGNGGAAAAAVYTAPDVFAGSVTFSLRRTDHWKYDGFWKGTHSIKSTDWKVLNQSDGVAFSFKATSTQLLNDVLLRVGYVGNSTMVIYVRIATISGNPVGSQVAYTPTSTVTSATITGLGASVFKGRRYRLEISYIPFGNVIPPAPNQGVINQIWTSTVNIYGYTVTDASWRIPATPASYFSISGNTGYTTSTGTFSRTVDVGSLPSADGMVTITDLTPVGTTLTWTLDYSEDNATWTTSSVTKSGSTVPAHRYWRFNFTMAANTAGDATPELSAIEVRFMGEPLLFGTESELFSGVIGTGFFLPSSLPASWIDIKNTYVSKHKVLNTISSFASQLSPKLPRSIMGSTSVELSPAPIVDSLLTQPLRGAAVEIEIGYEGITDKIKMYSGSVKDLSFSKSYKMFLTDNLELADMKVPDTKSISDVWATATAYALNKGIIHGITTYECILAHTSSASDEPGVGANWTTYWLLVGSVWASIDFSSTHLADAIKSLITDYINVPNERFDFQSLADIKTALPNRIGDRIITKPTSAMELIAEAAWLLESQFVIRNGLIALVQEPTSTTSVDENISPSDIKNGSVRYRRGWKELVNSAIVLSGYTGDGKGENQFALGEGYSDAKSISDYYVTLMDDFEDKWNLPSTELQTRLTNYINKYRDGRKVISCETAMRLIAVEPGDVVLFKSGQLPAGERNTLKMMVLKKDMDWGVQTLSFTLLGV